jgi:hypothetical protein
MFGEVTDAIAFEGATVVYLRTRTERLSSWSKGPGTPEAKPRTEAILTA